MRSILFPAFTLAFALPGAALAEPAMTTMSTLMREGPSSQSPVVQRIPANAEIDASGCGAYWCAASWRGLDGYVRAEAISFDEAGAPPPPPPVYDEPPPPPVVIAPFPFGAGDPHDWDHHDWDHHHGGPHDWDHQGDWHRRDGGDRPQNNPPLVGPRGDGGGKPHRGDPRVPTPEKTRGSN